MIVLDASALVDVVAARPDRDFVLDHLDGPILAPGHQLAEVGSAITRLLRAGEIDVATAEYALGEAAALDQQTIPVDATQLSRAFALRESIRITDALYVDLAQSNGCPLLTTDSRLARSAPPCRILCPDVAG